MQTAAYIYIQQDVPYEYVYDIHTYIKRGRYLEADLIIWIYVCTSIYIHVHTAASPRVESKKAASKSPAQLLPESEKLISSPFS